MNRFLEIFWLALTVITFLMAMYLLIVEGYERSKFMIMIPLVPLAMYIMRRGLRVRLEKNQKKARQKKNSN